MERNSASLVAHEDGKFTLTATVNGTALRVKSVGDATACALLNYLARWEGCDPPRVTVTQRVQIEGQTDLLQMLEETQMATKG